SGEVRARLARRGRGAGFTAEPRGAEGAPRGGHVFREAFVVLQKIGKALMIPVAVLPVAGLLLGIGAAQLEWISPIVSALMKASGDVVFGNLPLIFAVGVAVGLTENDGVAAISAVVGYVVLLAILGVMAGVWGIQPVTVMGIKSMQTGVFGGILAGP